MVPCQFISAGGRRKLKQHRRLLFELWNNFVILADRFLHAQHAVVIEWPGGCSYWQIPEISQWLTRHKFKPVNVDGCALGLTSIRFKGKPIRKPWTIATNDAYLFRKFQNKVCPGTQQHPEHCPAAANTQR